MLLLSPVPKILQKLYLCWSRCCHESSYENSSWGETWISEWEILTENQTCQDPESIHLKWWTSQPTLPSLNSKTEKTVAHLFSKQSAAHLRFLAICSLLQNGDHYLILQHKTTLGCVIEIKKIQRKNLCKLISPPFKKKLWAFFSEQWAVRIDCYSDAIQIRLWIIRFSLLQGEFVATISVWV